MLLVRPLTLLSQLMVLLLLTSDCYGTSQGAPEGACNSLTPSHRGNNPQSTEFPYMLKATPTTVHPGGMVTLTISPKASSGTAPIKGFFAQARNAQSPESSSALGQFKISSQQKGVACNGPAGGITHSSSSEKESVTVTWEAPSNLDTDVVFLVSVVQQFDTFWAGMPSETITLVKEPTAEPEPEPEATPEPSADDDDDDDDDDGKNSASLARVGAALLVAPLVMIGLQRLH